MGKATGGLVQAQVALLLAAGSIETTAGATGIDVSAFEDEAIAVLNVTNDAGTNPLLDVKLQECDTVGGDYTDIAGAAFDQVDDSAAGDVQKLVISVKDCKQFIRAHHTIAGTDSPAFSTAVTLVAVPKYSA